MHISSGPWLAGIYIALAVGVLPAASFCAVTSCGDHLSAFALLPLDSYERNTDQPSLMLSSSSSSSSSISSSPSSSSNTDVPSSALLEIALIPQAPFGNWNPPFDEACEEASLLMAYTYVRNDPLTLREAEAEIIAMTDWQQQNGYAVDVSVSELSRIAREHYGLEATVYTGDDVTKSFIKNMVASGSPVIVPVAGQKLGNPYFRRDGPPYHMIVIIGYDEENFITNDPGTVRGEEYAYDQDLIMDAIHDWNGSKQTILSGQKALLVVR